jgi:hypothetical protein
MIEALVGLAARSGATTVIAHTLPENNASNGALRAEGFGFSGQVLDPEDGPVWRWGKRLERGADDGASGATLASPSA